MPEALPGDLVLRAGAAQAVLRPQAGGRVCSLTLAHPDGRAVPVLYPYDAAGVDPVNWAKGGIYPLVPYSNRIARGQLRTAAGATVTLPPHPNAQPHTLHGHAHGLPWHVVQHDAVSAHLRLASPACAAWPWPLQADLQVVLSAHAIALSLSLRHGGVGDMPAGIGFHPYFLHHAGARLRYQAGRRWPADADYLAHGSEPLPAGQGFDQAKALPPGTLTDYLSAWDGALDLELPEGDVLHLQTDSVLSHLVVHRPPQPIYLCLEPVSHVADGFNLAARGVPDTGTVQLPPGEVLQGRLSIRLGDHLF
jgi:aldose 1-epimerase